MIFDISLPLAFLAGLISFLSPCVLPIVPGFLAYLAGSTEATKASRMSTLIASVWFVIGFSTVFACIGVVLNTFLSHVAYDAQLWLSRIGGVIVIFFGLYLTGILRIALLERPHVMRVRARYGSRALTSFLFGAAFAAGWTPCVGAALGAILGLAATVPTAAFALLMTYALGLGMPFILVGFFAEEAGRWIARLGSFAYIMNVCFGVLLIVVGALIFTQQLATFSAVSFVGTFFE